MEEGRRGTARQRGSEAANAGLAPGVEGIAPRRSRQTVSAGWTTTTTTRRDDTHHHADSERVPVAETRGAQSPAAAAGSALRHRSCIGRAHHAWLCTLARSRPRP
jgi:hypothetical protein